MRVLIEYHNKRVDIKTPISLRDKREDTPLDLSKLITQALSAHELNLQGWLSPTARGHKKGA